MPKAMDVIIGLIFIIAVGVPVILALVNDSTELSTFSGTLTADNSSYVSVGNSDVVAATFALWNASGNLTTSDYDLNAADGTVLVNNSAYNTQTLQTEYSYEGAQYADSSIVRLILPLVLIAVALGALLLAFSMSN